MDLRLRMHAIFDFVAEHYYLFIVPLLSIAVYLSLQYLTRGMEFFINNENNIKWRFLLFVAALQFFVSVLITWSVLSAFSSDYLKEYATLKVTAIIIIGAAPFNITILIWVALKLEAYKLMHTRYGDDFKDDSFFKKTEDIEQQEKQNKKE